MSIMIYNGHTKGASTSRNGNTDGAHTNDTQCAATQIKALNIRRTLSPTAIFYKIAFSIMRRLAVAINVKASSATVSLRTPGVLP